MKVLFCVVSDSAYDSLECSFISLAFGIFLFGIFYLIIFRIKVEKFENKKNNMVKPTIINHLKKNMKIIYFFKY